MNVQRFDSRSLDASVFLEQAKSLGDAAQLVLDLKANVEWLQESVNGTVHGVRETVKSAGELKVVTHLSNPMSAARLEKGVLGTLKALMTLSYFGTIWVPAQVICSILGFGIAAKGMAEDGSRFLVAVSAMDLKKMSYSGDIERGFSLMVRPSAWLINLAALSLDDMKQAMTGQMNATDTNKGLSMQALAEELEAGVSSAFHLGSRSKVGAIEKIASTVCKSITVGTFVLNWWVPSQVVSGIVGLGVAGASYIKGGNTQHGLNAASGPTQIVGAYIKSIYRDYQAFMT